MLKNKITIILSVLIVIALAVVAYLAWRNVKNTNTDTISTTDSVSNPEAGLKQSSTRTATDDITSSSTTSSTTSDKTSSTGNSDLIKASTTVSFSNGAFVPSSLTLKLGETVAFTNNSGNSINVASDPYPENTSYLPLNLGIVLSGQTSNAVSFPAKGTYHYHNNLISTQTGTIVVN